MTWKRLRRCGDWRKIPFLYGDRFVGRIEVVPDRKNRILVVKGLWWEAGVRQIKKLQKALDQTLNRFAKFNDCDGVSASQLLEQFDFRTIKQEEADETKLRDEFFVDAGLHDPNGKNWF